MQAVIMAGGKGTRLLEITRDEIPKPMAPIAGKPILEWQMECLCSQGVTDIILIIGHLGHKIREYFGNGKAFGLSISYIEEQEPLGTAGALALLPPLLHEESFFLVFGDVLFDIDLRRMLRFHREKQSLATLFVHPNTHPFDSDLVDCDEKGRVLRFDSKNNVRDYWYRNCVNAGFYILENSLCGRVELGKKTDLEKELLSELVKEGAPVYGYRSPEYIKDVGTIERIRKAEEELGSGLVTARCLRGNQKAIFFDRDVMFNKKNALFCEEEQLELENCAIEAIHAINSSGYLAVLVTNQSVAEHGLCAIEDVERINRKLETLLGQAGVYLDDICSCTCHSDKDAPEERLVYKIPSVRIVEDAAKLYNIDLSVSWMIGDTTMDMQSWMNVGMKTVLVLSEDTGKEMCGAFERTYSDLFEAVQEILREKGKA